MTSPAERLVARAAWGLLPLAVGCVGPCPEGSVGATGDCAIDTAAPAAPSTEGGPASWPADPASLGLTEVPGALEAALDGGVADPWGTLRAWLELFEHADAACPNGTAENLFLDYAGCDTSDGWHFAGIGELRQTESSQGPGFELSNDCEVIEPDGTRYIGAGNLSMEAPTDRGRFWVHANASFAWPSAVGLLGRGYSILLEMEGTLTLDGGSFTLEGTRAVGSSAVSFEGVAVDTADCPHGTGTIGLRDPSGGWHTLVLDEACDGCGTVSYDGTETGRACVDLAPLWATSLAVLRATEEP